MVSKLEVYSKTAEDINMNFANIDDTIPPEIRHMAQKLRSKVERLRPPITTTKDIDRVFGKGVNGFHAFREVLPSEKVDPLYVAENLEGYPLVEARWDKIKNSDEAKVRNHFKIVLMEDIPYYVISRTEPIGSVRKYQQKNP